MTNLQGIFDLINFYIIKVEFRASNFEAALQLQIVAKWKMLGISVTFGVKSVEKHLIRKNFLNWRPSNASLPLNKDKPGKAFKPTVKVRKLETNV